MFLRVRRLESNPMLKVESDPTLEGNVNGPSLIRAPEWLAKPLGRYYLYFAHHKGAHIRLASADALEGPWHIHAPGTLQLPDSRFPTTAPVQIRDTPHIASPDAHVFDETREIRMYYHGLLEDGTQRSRVAVSSDGIRFRAREEILGRSYFRVFRHGDWHYAIAMPGILYRSRDGLTSFEQGPFLFGPDMRHSALLRRDGELLVFWTRVGDAPERVLCSRITLSEDWSWQASEAVEVLRPETAWEGAELPLEPSVRGPVMKPVNQLRDPAIFLEGDRTYLLYAIAGEHGLAIAELEVG